MGPKRLKYSEESITAACQAVRNGNSLRTAAKEHGVPHTTLRDRLKGRISIRQRFGYDPLEGFQEAHLARSSNGWIDTEIFQSWFETAFCPSVAHLQKPVVLFADGHATHLSMKVHELCNEHGIIVYQFPSHASHLIQPLDLTTFKSLKQVWREEVMSFQERTSTTLGKKDFAAVFKKAWERGVPKDVVVSGFRGAGIFPWNPARFDRKKLTPSRLFATPTRTETETRTPTQAETETRTPTQTETETRTPTQAETETRTPTQTETETRTPTRTETRTPTQPETRLTATELAETRQIEETGQTETGQVEHLEVMTTETGQTEKVTEQPESDQTDAPATLTLVTEDGQSIPLVVMSDVEEGQTETDMTDGLNLIDCSDFASQS
ncbi:hypothetical protein ACOMHN_019088 [Nucella lapillus]